MLSRHEYLNTVYRQAKCCRVGPGGCGYRSLIITTSAAVAAAAIKGVPAPDRHFDFMENVHREPMTAAPTRPPEP